MLREIRAMPPKNAKIKPSHFIYKDSRKVRVYHALAATVGLCQLMFPVPTAPVPAGPVPVGMLPVPVGFVGFVDLVGFVGLAVSVGWLVTVMTEVWPLINVKV